MKESTDMSPRLASLFSKNSMKPENNKNNHKNCKWSKQKS